MQTGSLFSMKKPAASFGVDDVASLGLGMAGIDRTAGNSDDYIPVLEYGGVSRGCGYLRSKSQVPASPSVRVGGKVSFT